MDDRNVIANRDEAIPVLRLSSRDDDDISPSVSDSEAKGGKREKFMSNVGKFKDKVEEYSTPEARQTLQDRMFASILSQIVPPDDMGDGGNDTYQPCKKDRRSKKYVDRYDGGGMVERHADSIVKAGVWASIDDIQFPSLQLEDRDCICPTEPLDPFIHLEKSDCDPVFPGHPLLALP